MAAQLFQQLPDRSRVLFIRLRNLGEAVLDTANLRAVRQFRPDLQLTTLVEAIYTDLYEADPGIEALALPRRSGDRRSAVLDRLRLVREIRRRGFAAVVNLHGGPTSAQLTFASGARFRVGAAHFRNGYAYNVRIPRVEDLTGRTEMHTVEYQFEQFRWLGPHKGVVQLALASVTNACWDLWMSPSRDAKPPARSSAPRDSILRALTRCSRRQMSSIRSGGCPSASRRSPTGCESAAGRSS